MERVAYKLFAIFLLALASCGPAPKVTGITPSASDSPIQKGSNFTIKIIRDAVLMRANADSSGNPPNYLTGGGLIPKAQAVAQLVAGNVLCYAKISNYTPAAGDQIDASLTNVTQSQFGRTLQYMNIMRKNDSGTATFALTCMKLKAQVQPIDVINAFRTVVGFTQY